MNSNPDHCQQSGSDEMEIILVCPAYGKGFY